MILEVDVGWMEGRASLGVVKIRNIVYQVWGVKCWDREEVPDTGGVTNALQDLGTNQTWYVRERGTDQGVEPGCHRSTWLIWKSLL